MIPVDVTSEGPSTGTSDEVTHRLLIDSMANLIGDVPGNDRSTNDESTLTGGKKETEADGVADSRADVTRESARILARAAESSWCGCLSSSWCPLTNWKSKETARRSR